MLCNIRHRASPTVGVHPVTRLFLDTEWADASGQQLVSLALLSEDCVHRFYAEIDPLPTSTTLFVRTVVYPLLQRGDAALSATQFTRRLRRFLARSAERRVGKEGVSTCRSRWTPYTKKKNTKKHKPN